MGRSVGKGSWLQTSWLFLLLLLLLWEGLSTGTKRALRPGTKGPRLAHAL